MKFNWKSKEMYGAINFCGPLFFTLAINYGLLISCGISYSVETSSKIINKLNIILVDSQMSVCIVVTERCILFIVFNRLCNFESD